MSDIRKFWYIFDRRHFWVLLKATCYVAVGKKFKMTLITCDMDKK